jgi:hypothetical protein|tara:strand:- start:6365 stop:6979 length:615 start_codon:yes stop_codon:yes gene_type:complete
MKIDWSKAPDGATHFYINTLHWFKIKDDGIFKYKKGEWALSINPKEWVLKSMEHQMLIMNPQINGGVSVYQEVDSVPKKPTEAPMPETKWDGEGLPPVGVEVVTVETNRSPRRVKGIVTAVMKGVTGDFIAVQHERGCGLYDAKSRYVCIEAVQPTTAEELLKALKINMEYARVNGLSTDEQASLLCDIIRNCDLPGVTFKEEE